MREAVIVSYARTGLAKSNRGGFNNTSNEDVVLVWGWMGAGSIETSGYEVPG